MNNFCAKAVYPLIISLFFPLDMFEFSCLTPIQAFQSWPVLFPETRYLPAWYRIDPLIGAIHARFRFYLSFAGTR